MNTVDSAKLEAKLRQHLRADQAGDTVTTIPRAPTLHEVPLPPPLDLDFDIVELLLAERQIDR